MARSISGSIPQVIAVASIKADGKLNLKKAVRQHVGLKDGEPLLLSMGDEVLLSSGRNGGEKLVVSRGGRACLPETALNRLGICEECSVGLVQRQDAVAVKVIETVEVEGERPSLVDMETASHLSKIGFFLGQHLPNVHEEAPRTMWVGSLRQPI